MSQGVHHGCTCQCSGRETLVRTCGPEAVAPAAWNRPGGGDFPNTRSAFLERRHPETILYEITVRFDATTPAGRSRQSIGHTTFTSFGLSSGLGRCFSAWKRRRSIQARC